jgi:deoxyribodipyrimidine photo-lyase
LPYSLDKFPHLFGKFKKDIANISVRNLLNEPEKDEMPFPHKDELFLPGMMGFVKSNNSIEFVPTLEDFKFTEEEFARLENYNQREGVDYYPLVGGEDAANKRLNEYLWEKNIVSRHLYSAVSFHFNGDSSPKITPWTSIGCISPRKIFLEIIEYEAMHKRGENKSKDPNSPEPAECFKRDALERLLRVLGFEAS